MTSTREAVIGEAVSSEACRNRSVAALRQHSQDLALYLSCEPRLVSDAIDDAVHDVLWVFGALAVLHYRPGHHAPTPPKEIPPHHRQHPRRPLGKHFVDQPRQRFADARKHRGGDSVTERACEHASSTGCKTAAHVAVNRPEPPLVHEVVGQREEGLCERQLVLLLQVPSPSVPFVSGRQHDPEQQVRQERRSSAQGTAGAPAPPLRRIRHVRFVAAVVVCGMAAGRRRAFHRH
jgi:hypothetical protein